MLEEWGPARKLADRRAMRHPPPAVELAVRVTAKLTFSGAGHVVRQNVSLPAGAKAGTRCVGRAPLPSTLTENRPLAPTFKPAKEVTADSEPLPRSKLIDISRIYLRCT